MNRRAFLGSILALGAAPAIVRASSLMPIRPPESQILRYTGWEIIEVTRVPTVVEVGEEFSYFEQKIIIYNGSFDDSFQELVRRAVINAAPTLAALVKRNNALLRQQCWYQSETGLFLPEE